eukprot:scaffold7351_cov259-Pinguiococcus_pyrenoidosus.AAC.3
MCLTCGRLFSQIYSKKVVDSVIVPGADGEYGVTAGHSPIVAELKAGVVQVLHKGSADAEKFFVSGGFALSHEDDTTDISAPEIARLEDLDENAIRTGFADATTKLSSAGDETAKAEAQIEMETFKAMGAALGIAL